MTRTQIIEGVKKLPDADKEEVALFLRHEGYGIEAPPELTFNSESELKKKILEGRNSGTAKEMTDRDWDALRTGDRSYLKKQWGI